MNSGKGHGKRNGTLMMLAVASTSALALRFARKDDNRKCWTARAQRSKRITSAPRRILHKHVVAGLSDECRPLSVEVRREGLAVTFCATHALGGDDIVERSWSTMRSVVLGERPEVMQDITRQEVGANIPPCPRGMHHGGVQIFQEAKWRCGFMRGTSSMNMEVTVNDNDKTAHFNLIPVDAGNKDVLEAYEGTMGVETSTLVPQLYIRGRMSVRPGLSSAVVARAMTGAVGNQLRGTMLDLAIESASPQQS